MDINLSQFQLCVDRGIINADQARQVADALSPQASDGEIGRFTRMLNYVGGFLMVFAVTFFVCDRWESLSDSARILTSLLLAVGFVTCGVYVRRTPYGVASSLLLLAGTACMPLFFYSVERATGLWPSQVSPTYQGFIGTVNAAWVMLDALSLGASWLMFRHFRDGLLTLPVAHFVWFLALDGGDALYGDANAPWLTSMSERANVTLLAGGLLVVWGLWLHLRRDAKIGVWPWIYGLLMILGSLITLRWDTSQMSTWQTCLLLYSVATLVIGPWLNSRTFITFGSLALLIYTQDVYWTLYHGSLGFPGTLIVLGGVLMALAAFLQSHTARRGVA